MKQNFSKPCPPSHAVQLPTQNQNKVIHAHVNILNVLFCIKYFKNQNNPDLTNMTNRQGSKTTCNNKY